MHYTKEIEWIKEKKHNKSAITKNIKKLMGEMIIVCWNKNKIRTIKQKNT